jgi:hypothetical protein
VNDEDAFVFNMENKYTPKKDFPAISTFYDGGFGFGRYVLEIASDPLNVVYGGFGKLEGNNFFNIENDSEGNNPLFGKPQHFTCTQLEVFRIFFDKEKPVSDSED